MWPFCEGTPVAPAQRSNEDAGYIIFIIILNNLTSLKQNIFNLLGNRKIELQRIVVFVGFEGWKQR